LIREEIGQIKYQGEQVYHTPAHNALASRMVIDQLTPHLPKDNKEVNMHVKHLQAMLDTAIMVDPVHNQDDGNQGQELDHQQSQREDLAISLTPPEEHGRWHVRDDRDLCNIIHG
jgi:hypothetical protein